MANFLIPNGIYNIENIEFSGSVVNLVGGEVNGAVTGFPIRGHEGSPNLRWRVENVGNNQVTLESVAANDYYATAVVNSKAAPLYAAKSEKPARWTIAQVSPDVFHIISEGGWQWSLTSGGENGSIFLGPVGRYSHGEAQQWRFKGH